MAVAKNYHHHCHPQQSTGAASADTPWWLRQNVCVCVLCLRIIYFFLYSYASEQIQRAGRPQAAQCTQYSKGLPWLVWRRNRRVEFSHGNVYGARLNIFVSASRRRRTTHDEHKWNYQDRLLLYTVSELSVCVWPDHACQPAYLCMHSAYTCCGLRRRDGRVYTIYIFIYFSCICTYL